jgi:hypothetical protein
MCNQYNNRSSLLPDRAEQLILFAARFAIKQSHGTLTVPTIVDIGVPFSNAEVIARDDLVDEGIVEEEQELEELPDAIPWYEAVDEGVGGADDA